MEKALSRRDHSSQRIKGSRAAQVGRWFDVRIQLLAKRRREVITGVRMTVNRCSGPSRWERGEHRGGGVGRRHSDAILGHGIHNDPGKRCLNGKSTCVFVRKWDPYEFSIEVSAVDQSQIHFDYRRTGQWSEIRRLPMEFLSKGQKS